MKEELTSYMLRKLLGGGISPFRAEKSAKAYVLFGQHKGSPLIEITGK